ASVGADGRYQGLRFGSGGGTINLDGVSVLLKPDVAAKQLEEDERKGKEVREEPGEYKIEVKEDERDVEKPPRVQPPKRFHGSVTVDPTRLARDVGQIAQEVVQHLAGLVGSKVEITIEIQARIPDGAPDHVVRTVTENCRTLRFKTHGFEEV
ncbi:MAG: AAA+ family ATPase, partial [Acidobacteriota bacterium]